MSERAPRHAVIALLLLIAVTFAGLAPIRSYDFFWHLATGRWILDHHALPLTDPFAVASDRVPWINGEWLFDAVIASIRSVHVIAWLRAAFVGALFATVFALAAADGFGVALVLTLLAFAASPGRLDARPSTIAAALIAAAVALLSRERDRRETVAYVALTVIWINVHPSALLAPVLAMIRVAGEMFEARLLSPNRAEMPDSRRAGMPALQSLLLPVASAAALLVNPYGYHAITAPIDLMEYARSGAFVNAEWLRSPLAAFPLFYISVAAGILCFLVSTDRARHVWRFVVFALLAWLAVSHVRNQGLYLAAFPLLVAPVARRHWPQRMLALGGAAILLLVLIRGEYHDGIDGGRFPVAAVSRLKATQLRGNIYNPDQFGGFLIWSFYPERRTLTDGRNELYRTFIPEYARARLDSRAWHALLQKYRIDLAVDEYRPPLDVIDSVTRRHRALPASLAYWPRRQWALIAYDGVAMVFARRAAFPADSIARWEIARVVPDAHVIPSVSEGSDGRAAR